jgi:hypothetical protein
MKTHNDP